MNSIAAATPRLDGAKPSRFGLRTRILVLAAIFVVTLGIATEAKAHLIYGYTPWGVNTSWSWNGNYCLSTISSSMTFNHHGSPGFWQSRAVNGFGWGTGQPWCSGVAAKGWIYRPGGSWLQGSWAIDYAWVGATGYSPWVVAGGAQVQGEGQYQANHNGEWSNYFQWGDVMYPPTLY